MGAVIVVILFGIVGLCATGYAVWASGKPDESPLLGVAIAAGCAVLAGAILFFASVVTVGTSDVGIETAFGRTVGDLPPGFHLKAPWDSVTTWDGSVQTIDYPRGAGCLQVRIGNQQSACVALTFQYQVRDGAADQLFRKYRTQSVMTQRLVVTSLDQTVNNVLETYSPIEAAATGNTGAAALSPYAARVVDIMRQQIGSLVNVEKLFIPYATYDPQTTARLNALQTQRADTLIAQEAVKTAEQQKLANDKLAQSVANANVIANNCVNNVLIPIVKAGGTPSGISCWPGSGGSTVVVPAK